MKRWCLVFGMWLSTGCGSTVAPPVVCPEDRLLINLEQTATIPRTGSPCAFADPFPFTVSYAPEVDASTGDKSIFKERLSGQQVTVTQSNASTRLCAQVASVCQDGVSSIATKISSSGILSYQGIFTLEPLGVVLNAGDTFNWEGDVLTENFGLGNSCPWKGKVKLTCQKAQ